MSACQWTTNESDTDSSICITVDYDFFVLVCFYCILIATAALDVALITQK